MSTKKYDFSKLFKKKDFENIRQTITLDPNVYSQLYKDLGFPRNDYVMRVEIKKVEGGNKNGKKK